MAWYRDENLTFEELGWTDHSQLRQSHRYITDFTVWMTIQWGKRYHRYGQIHYTVRAKDIPPHLAHKPAFERMIGVTVVADQYKPIVITVYRDRETANSRLRKKSKRKRRRKGQKIH